MRSGELARGAVFISSIIALGVPAAAHAEAQTPANSNVIYACVQEDGAENGQHSIRVVNPSDPCGRKEKKIYWNVVGPQGPMGPQGPTGTQGPKGPVGPQG